MTTGKEMTGLWQRLGDIVRSAGGAALITVVGVRGSVPREAGARMIVAPDGGYSGTIGGGMLEYEAIALARRRLAGGAAGAHLRRLSLGPELGQCCGGLAVLLIECFAAEDLADIADLAAREAGGALATSARFVDGEKLTRRPVDVLPDMPAARLGEDNVVTESFADTRHPVVLFGAGHVGRAVVLAFAPLPFRLTWVDGRPDAFPAVMPANVTARRLDDPADAIATAEADAFVLVMTHSHPLDLEICRAALWRHELLYVGLIGSATKRARFVSRLRAAGLAEPDLARLVCPIGLVGLSGKAPAEIAASVAADLLLRRQALAPGRAAASAMPAPAADAIM